RQRPAQSQKRSGPSPPVEAAPRPEWRQERYCPGLRRKVERRWEPAPTGPAPADTPTRQKRRSGSFLAPGRGGERWPAGSERRSTPAHCRRSYPQATTPAHSRRAVPESRSRSRQGLERRSGFECSVSPCRSFLEVERINEVELRVGRSNAV